MTAAYGAIAALLLAIASFAFGYHEGGLSGRLKDTQADLKQTDQNLKIASADAVTVNQEAKTYASAQLDPVSAPVVRVCYYAAAAAVPATAAAGSGAHVPAAVRAADPLPAVPGPNIGRPLVQIGHTANAQVAGLQDYIAHVCRVPAP